MNTILPTPSGFAGLGLIPAVTRALAGLGYAEPSPIQASAIPLLLEGHDLLGQAQTGTGKTAAFALPMLSRLDLAQRSPQLLVLAPTRELAMQVAEAFRRYGTHLPGLRVLPIYGGQSYGIQVRGLSRGPQVVVGTPGRVIDHMRRGTLSLASLRALVLDEADEMLRMGFIDDVRWILERTPDARQVALFSATMPREVRRIAERHLHQPRHVRVQAEGATAATIRQCWLSVQGQDKFDALTRLIEVQDFDAMLVFVRTRAASEELAKRLSAYGRRATALHGDIAQAQRESIVQRLRQGQLDVLVATDVVARGLDVERISHVVNYDMPHDREAYIHRIGRTGRAGNAGTAILFATSRERRMLRVLEQASGGRMERLTLPAIEQVNARRIERFSERIGRTLAEAGDLSLFAEVVDQYARTHQLPVRLVAAALAHMACDGKPLLREEPPMAWRKHPRRKPFRGTRR